MTEDPNTERRHAPATARNREPILAVLRRVLPSKGTILEVASGTGEHAVFFSTALPDLIWQPTDADPAAIASIAAWRTAEGGSNLLPPMPLDVTAHEWPLDRADAIFSANMIHIAPWEACLGLLAGAERCLAPGGTLILYGPFRLRGEHTSASNAAFDRDLQARDPRWGVRDLAIVEQEANAAGLELEERVEMPANNQMVVMRRL